jgi:hypothetical protein
MKKKQSHPFNRLSILLVLMAITFSNLGLGKTTPAMAQDLQPETPIHQEVHYVVDEYGNVTVSHRGPGTDQDTSATDAACPPAPTLVSPADGSDLDTLIPELHWDNGNDPDATGLRVWWSSDPGFVYPSSVIYRGFLDTSWQINRNLLPETIYYWRVQFLCGEEYEDGEFSDVWSFTTGSGGTIPAAPELLSPSNGSTVKTEYFNLEWEPVSGVNFYKVHWREVGSPGYTYTLTEDTHLGFGGPWYKRGTYYEWWVEAGNDYAMSDSSAVWNFYWAGNSITFRSTAAQDGWILESTETSNKGGKLNKGATTLQLGDDATRKQYLSILSFDTSSIPDNAVITKVTLKVKQQGITGGGNPVNMFQGFMVDIKRGSFGAPALVVSDFQAKANKTLGPVKKNPNGSGWYVLNLTPGKNFVNKLASGNGLTQIRLRFKLDDNNNGKANFLKLFSGNAPAASRPQLIVEYNVP